MKKNIITISHFPSTAGTFITHFVGKSLANNAWITSETNVCGVTSRQAFVPNDPWSLIRTNDQISGELWEKEYSRRICELVDLYLRNETTDLLIIRDHAWSESINRFKRGNGKVHPFLTMTLREKNVAFHSVFTHRDPFDAWLGMRVSFPYAVNKIHIDEFAILYKITLEAWRSANPDLIEFSIERLASQTEQLMDEVCVKIYGESDPITRSVGVLVEPHELGSGASGRRSTRPYTMTRRTEDVTAYSDAVKSTPLNELRRSLGYTSPIILPKA